MSPVEETAEVSRIARVYKDYWEAGLAGERWKINNPGNLYALSVRRRLTCELLQSNSFLPLAGRRVLDIGCGAGRELAYLLNWGGTPECLYGVDVLPLRVEEARKSFPQLTFECRNAESLGFRDEYFDLVLLHTVVTSILDDRMAANVARETCRVLKPGGAVLWYDFRYDNPHNPNVRGMTKKSLRALFPDLTMRLRTVTLLPPLARRLGRMTPLLYPALNVIPFLRTHYLGLLIRGR